MAVIHRQTRSPKSQSPKIVIPAGIIKELEALPNKRNHKVLFTAQDDEIIRLYGKQKSLEAIAFVLGKGEKTVRRRYKELIGL